MYRELAAQEDFQGILEHALHLLEGRRLDVDPGTLEAAVGGFCRRVVMALSYIPSTKLTTDVTLIKATTIRQAARHIGDDYGLKKVITRTEASDPSVVVTGSMDQIYS